MSTPPSPKRIWTHDDFAKMGWHDNAVHAFSLEYVPPWPGRVLIDIDYIIEWVTPPNEGDSFRFWVCPATLAFEDASDFKADVDLSGRTFELSLDEIVRSEPDEHDRFVWRLIGHEFSASVVSAGFTQYLRSTPVLSDSQRLARSIRGAPSFLVGE